MANMYDTREFRKGLKVLMNNDPWMIVEFQHISPGKGAAFTRTKFKNLRTGHVVEHNIKSGDKLEKPDLEERSMQYLYSDTAGYHFMDTANYEQVSLEASDIGDTKFYLTENCVIKGLFFNGKPIGIETDTFVELRVKETPPGIRGDTATGGNKVAIMETGLSVTVPFHINEGDILRIDTRENMYMERVKK